LPALLSFQGAKPIFGMGSFSNKYTRNGDFKPFAGLLAAVIMTDETGSSSMQTALRTRPEAPL